MTLHDILILAKFYLNIKDPDNREEILLKCCNICYRFTAQNYLPLYYSETVAVNNGIVFFRDLEKNIITLKKVTKPDKAGARYTLHGDRIETPEPEIVIAYTYLPDETGLNDTLAYGGGRVDARLLALGAAAEFCLITGLYDDAAVFDARYNDAVRAAQRRAGGSVRERRFK